jgi:transglutaminase-like putative cysteine protease
VLQAQLQGDLSLAHYWRALTLEHFTGRGWTSGQSVMKVVLGIGNRGQPSRMHGTFELFADASSRYVPVPEELRMLWPRPGVRLRESDSGDIRLVFSVPEREEFSVAAGGENPAEPKPEELARDLQLPELSPKIAKLARQLMPDGASAEDAIRDVERYFEGFRYSRELHPSNAPLDDFIDRRDGHCELFASATTVLLRARGIPARYVAGFYPDEPRSDTLTIREWDAHAWAEAYVAGKGFVLVDTTPPDLRGARLSHTNLWQHLLDLWDSAQLDWLHAIVDFDAQTQASSAGWLVRGLEAFVWSVLSPSAAMRVRLLGLVLLLALAYLWYRLPRRQTPALRLEQALFKRLAARGLPRAAHETYEEALGTIRERDAELARETEPILARLAAARFGGRALGPGEAEALRSRIQRLG